MDEEVRLREVEPADLELFLEYEHDPEAIRRSRFTPRPRAAFLTHWRTVVLGDPTVLVRTVLVDDVPAGSIVAWWQEDRRYVGYWFGRTYWGRGIGGVALRRFLAEEKHRPLYADPHSDNTGSVRLLEKCGFRRTGEVEHRTGGEFVVLVLDE